MDNIQLTNQAGIVPKTPKPAEWSWISQRAESNGKAISIWKFGFIVPNEGSEVRVTFHQVESNETTQTPTQNIPSSNTSNFAPAGEPTSDQTENSIFYVTFFSNRNPEFFMKWDTSLSHEDSLVVWITITHGIIDFINKAQPKTVILDDLGNGKLKMVLRSVAMDVAVSNPTYELEQTQKHHYRSFYQIKRSGAPSAFEDGVSGTSAEGDNQQPNLNPNEVSGKDKTDDPTIPQPQNSQNSNQQSNDQSGNDPAFPVDQPVPIKQTPLKNKGLSIEISRDDYSVTVKDKDGNPVDRYVGKNPADILRWINAKNYGSSKMMIVSTNNQKPENTSQESTKPQLEQFTINQNKITVMFENPVDAFQAANLNYIINASTVKLVPEGLEFVFETSESMEFKKDLVELACKKTNLLS